MRVSFDEAKKIIKQKTNLVDFFTRKGYDLKPSGASRYVTLCPFHSEKTPSFTISETRNNWKCYGCGKSGDVFTYLMDKEGLSFPDSIRQMADEIGIELSSSNEDVEKSNKRALLMEIISKTWEWFRARYDELPEDHIVKAHEIRGKRGISSDASDNHDLFGWAPENGQLLLRYLKSNGYDTSDMMLAGVIYESKDGESYYCPWRGRLMFPICDVLGKPLGFVGRQVFYHDGDKIERKYVNSRESDVYRKRDLLFCQSIAREQAHRDHQLFVVEGQFDVIAMQHAGYENTVASSGTALGDQQVQSMRRMVGPEGKLVFMFDADDAGQKAAARTLAVLGPAQSQAYASITSGKDPSDMYHDDGAEALRAQASSYVELWRHVVEHLAGRYDLSKPDQRQAFLAEFKDKIWSHLTDPSISESAARLAALLSGSSYSTLVQQLGPISRSNDSGVDDHGDIMVDSIIGNPDLSTSPTAAALLANVLDNPGLRPILSMVRMSGMDEEMREIILDAGDEILIPESFDDDRRAYLERLDRIINQLHDLERAAPVLMNPAQLAKQQVEALLKDRKHQREQSLIASNIDAGQSDNPTIMRTYDEIIRRGMEKINSRYERNLEKATALVEEISERNGYAEKAKTLGSDYLDVNGVDHDLDSNEGNSSNDENYAINLESFKKSRMDDDAYDLVDPNEPVMGTVSGPECDDDAPYYDPSDYEDQSAQDDDWADWVD
jgi:DNA primase